MDVCFPYSETIFSMMFPSFTVNFKSVDYELLKLRRCIFSGKKFVAGNLRSCWWCHLVCMASQMTNNPEKPSFSAEKPGFSEKNPVFLNC